MSMFCRQCEQTFRWQACETKGVCGKLPETAALQDVLIHILKGMGYYGTRARQQGLHQPATDYFFLESIFATLTNVNFDNESLFGMITRAAKLRADLKDWLQKNKSSLFPHAIADWQPGSTLTEILAQAPSIGLMANLTMDEDIRSLREILLYGVKGTAAYAHHAWRVGQSDERVTGFLYKAMAALADETLDASALLGLILECGEANLVCMEILDRGHTTNFGHPQPTNVPLGYKKGKAIIVSGHELQDLHQLLDQTRNLGINVYTHGEMLPALAYPKFKEYPHFIGHYGTAWQNQQKEFENLPAAILMTTNCIQEPGITYEDRIFTTGAVGWQGIHHIEENANGQKDFTPVIQKALALPGFTEDNIEKEIPIGFAHHTLMGAAGQIIDAVKAGKIKRFFLIGGCDGARPGRNYFTKFAESVPDDCLILTLACGKNRINRLDYPTVAGFPQLLDLGQCNDAYSAIVIAKALAGAFECGINDLPISMIISWYEQKAVAVLLTLLFLGVKNIKLGPSLPAFITPNVLNILVEKFHIQPITTVEQDLAECLAGAK